MAAEAGRRLPSERIVKKVEGQGGRREAGVRGARPDCARDAGRCDVGEVCSRRGERPRDGRDRARERPCGGRVRGVLTAWYGTSMGKICLESISDDRLLERVGILVGRSNELTAELVAYLAEVDRRGLHRAQACSSLFVFCVERLHMSESAAGKRITAARVARRFPVVLKLMARGEVHLTAVNMLAAHLTEENHADVLARARHMSKRQVEKLVAEIAPRPDVRSQVVTLPRCAGAQVVHAPERAVDAPDSGADATEVNVEHAREPVARSAQGVARKRPAVVAPLSPRRYEIRVTVDEESGPRLRRCVHGGEEGSWAVARQGGAQAMAVRRAVTRARARGRHREPWLPVPARFDRARAGWRGCRWRGGSASRW